MIADVLLQPMRRISHPDGDILHGMKASDSGFAGFGEAYFSMVHQGAIKGWKKHQRMQLNLLVPVGQVRFVVFDDRGADPCTHAFAEYRLGAEHQHARLTVPPGVWMAFQGLDAGANMLLNLASIEHDPTEAQNCPLAEIQYTW